MGETWKQYMNRMGAKYGDLPNFITNVAERAEREEAMAVPEGKYQIWGFVARGNFDDTNRGVDSQQQTEEPELTCVYATDDKEEAKTIMRNGGYMRNEGTPQQTWVVAREGKVVGTNAGD